jgi:hypothetical protein
MLQTTVYNFLDFLKEPVNLVDIKVCLVRVLGALLGVILLQHRPQEPCEHNHTTRKTKTCDPRRQVSRSIRLWPQVGHVNGSTIAQTVGDGQGHGLLLVGLAHSGGDPAEEDVVDAKGEADKEKDGKVAGSNVEACDRDDEAADCDAFADGNVPCSLVPASGCPGHSHTEKGGENIWRSN